MALIELHPQIIERNGQKEYAVLPWGEFEKIRSLLEDAQDLRDLEAAIQEGEGKKPIPYEELRQELGLNRSEN